MVTTDGFDATAGNDALAVSKQNNLEQRGGWVGSSASCVVVEPGIEAGQVEIVVGSEVIEGVLEAAGKQLPMQVYSKETRAGVDLLVAGHAVCSITKSMTRC